jgi:hypothetical protein
VAAAAGCGRHESATPRVALWGPPIPSTAVPANVEFTGTQFVVENHGDVLWREVRILVGRDGDPPAFRYEADAILGARSVTVGALNFERPDGTRLSPFRLQPTRWAVVVTLPDGRQGFAEGRFGP